MPQLVLLRLTILFTAALLCTTTKGFSIPSHTSRVWATTFRYNFDNSRLQNRENSKAHTTIKPKLFLASKNDDVTPHQTTEPAPPPPSPPPDAPAALYAADPSDKSYSASDWLRNMKSMPKSSILRAIKGPVLATVTWSTLVSVVYKVLHLTNKATLAQKMCISSTPHSFLVGSLGLLLVFRTNSAYQRFAEGRKIWEHILSISRNISRMSSLYETDMGLERKRRVQRLLSAFPYLLRHHIQPQCLDSCECEQLVQSSGSAALLLLHEPSSIAISTGQRSDRIVTTTASSSSLLRAFSNGTDNTSHTKHEQKKKTATKTTSTNEEKTTTPRECWVNRHSLPWCLLPNTALQKCAQSTNRPLWICDRLAREFTDIPYSPNFSSRERLSFLSHVGKLSQCIGECERIQQTAVPLNYARHSLRSLTIWLFSLPFGLVKDLGLLTGPVMGVIAWLMFGVYQIGYAIEDPFQGSLRLNVLCDAVYRDVMFGRNRATRRDTAFHVDDELTEWNEMGEMGMPPPNTSNGGYSAGSDVLGDSQKQTGVETQHFKPRDGGTLSP